MSNPVDGQKLVADQLAERLTRLPALREAYERAKHACVGGKFPVSEERFQQWYEEHHTPSEEELQGEYNAEEEYRRAIPEGEEDPDQPPELRQFNDAMRKLSAAEGGVADLPAKWQRGIASELAERFPSLADAEGCKPFDSHLLELWLEKQSPGPGYHAGRFVLSLWRRDESLFNLQEAFAAWDDEHRQVFVEWLKHPVWPHAEMWGRY